MNECRGPGVFSGCPSLRVICFIGWVVSCSNRAALSVIYSRWFSAFLKKTQERSSFCGELSTGVSVVSFLRSHRRSCVDAGPPDAGGTGQSLSHGVWHPCIVGTIRSLLASLFFNKPRPRLVRAVGRSLQWPPGVVWEPGLSGSVGILPCCR